MKGWRPYLFLLLPLVLSLAFYCLYFSKNQKQGDSPSIQWIAQTGPLKEALKTEYFEELLDFSLDGPNHLHLKKAEEILRSSPLIEELSLSLLSPEVLCIDYLLRTPLFFLGDKENLAIDRSGNCFPFAPFFSPKRLPTLYLGEKPHPQALQIALYFLERLRDLHLIDLSKATCETLGTQEIVIGIGKQLLRFTPSHYEEEISNYLKMKKLSQITPLVIDLRIRKMAFISPLESSFEVTPRFTTLK